MGNVANLQECNYNELNLSRKLFTKIDKKGAQVIQDFNKIIKLMHHGF